MTLLLADSFASSLARLTGDEQKAVKTTAFDLQLNSANPGMQFHRLDKAKDRNFWSVRVSSDIRLIVHKTDDSVLLCYVDHHDAAYAWAERRKIEVHPSTGAAQLVEIRETVREIAIPRYVEAPAAPASARTKGPLFDGIEDDVLLSYGVPREWLSDVRQATEDSLLDLVGHLPGEAAEALLTVATGGSVTTLPALGASWLNTGEPAGDAVTAFSHPDAQRRFRVMATSDDLQRALDAPWDAWTVFLHPDQETLVRRRFAGPARVAGSAGTGKTVVALHRAVHLARLHPGARVLLTTFSGALAEALGVKLQRLAGADSPLRARLTISTLDRVGLDLYEKAFGPAVIATAEVIDRTLDAVSASSGPKLARRLLHAEFHEVVDAWQVTSWEAYRDLRRLGRKTRLGEAQRAAMWEVFVQARQALAQSRQVTMAEVLGGAKDHLRHGGARPFDYVVVDEAQDINVPQLKLLSALAGDRPDGLFFAGDLGQRIFQTPFSWKALGIDIRGRSQTLRINYRTSHQIRRQADRLLGSEVADVDGNTEVRKGTVSVFNGPEPTVQLFATESDERAAIGAWLRARAADGVAPAEMAVFVRSDAELPRAQAAIGSAGIPDVLIGTMHLAKGLEFRAVVVMACDDEVVPLQSRIEGVADEGDLEDLYNTERHLLYVACTRARDWLLVTGVRPGSEFLGDMGRV